jgi:hypothetical protein
MGWGGAGAGASAQQRASRPHPTVNPTECDLVLEVGAQRFQNPPAGGWGENVPRWLV